MIKKTFEYLILGILLAIAKALELLGWFEAKYKRLENNTLW